MAERNQATKVSATRAQTTPQETPVEQQAVSQAITRTLDPSTSQLASLPIADVSNYQLMSWGEGSNDIARAFRENIGSGAKLTAFEVDRVKVPSGDTPFWMVPGLAGPEMIKELIGVVVLWYDGKSYWKTALEDGAGGSPPDCQSPDMVQGFGDPGILCEACPKNVFGSDPKGGKGKACKDHRVLFFIREGDMIPMSLVVPPTSLKNIRMHFTKLASKGISYWACVTKLTLRVAGTNPRYCVIEPSMVGVVTADQKQRLFEFTAAMKNVIGRPVIVRSDLEGDGSSNVPNANPAPNASQNGSQASSQASSQAGDAGTAVDDEADVSHELSGESKPVKVGVRK